MDSLTGLTKLESIKGPENLPAFNIGYYQDQHFQSLISTEKKNESVEKTKKRSANTNIEKISKRCKILHECDQCSYTTSDQSNLKKHIKSVHEGFRIQCSKCTYKSSGTSNMTKHMGNK